LGSMLWAISGSMLWAISGSMLWAISGSMLCAIPRTTLCYCYESFVHPLLTPPSPPPPPAGKIPLTSHWSRRPRIYSILLEEKGLGKLSPSRYNTRWYRVRILQNQRRFDRRRSR
jgi:hypothetical protein